MQTQCKPAQIEVKSMYLCITLILPFIIFITCFLSIITFITLYYPYYFRITSYYLYYLSLPLLPPYYLLLPSLPRITFLTSFLTFLTSLLPPYYLLLPLITWFMDFMKCSRGDVKKQFEFIIGLSCLNENKKREWCDEFKQKYTHWML